MKYYMFDEYNEKKKKKLNKGRVLRTIIFTIIIALIIIFTILYGNNKQFRELSDKYIFRKEVNENNLSSIEYDSLKNSNIFAFDKYIGILEENTLKIYNQYCRKEEELVVEISNPIIDSNNKYLAIAEKGGNKIYSISSKNINWQKEIEGNISGISINKEGYMAVVVSGTTYKNIIIVYDAKGNELFKRYLAQTNAIDAEISNDNKYLAIAEANFSGIVTQSTIKIISIEKAKKGGEDSIIYTYIAESDNLIINIEYYNKDKLICMYDKHIDILEDGQNKVILTYKDNNVIYSDISLAEKVVEIVKKSTGPLKNEIEMKIFNCINEKEFIYSLESEPKDVIIQDNVIALNLGTSILFIKDNGWLIKEYHAKQEIYNIVLCNEIAGIIFKNRIEIISL